MPFCLVALCESIKMVNHIRGCSSEPRLHHWSLCWRVLALPWCWQVFFFCFRFSVFLVDSSALFETQRNIWLHFALIAKVPLSFSPSPFSYTGAFVCVVLYGICAIDAAKLQFYISFTFDPFLSSTRNLLVWRRFSFVPIYILLIFSLLRFELVTMLLFSLFFFKQQNWTAAFHAWMC